MISDNGKAVRSDRAVIMARGLSFRMGSPKGLLKFSAQGPAFVRLIADLYLHRDMPVDVLALAGFSDALARELPGSKECRVLPQASGGDTALTLLMSWRSCAKAGVDCSHFWAHPVDLPLVTPETLDLLAENSRRHPTRIIRPVRVGIPGHPVILPYDVLEELNRRASFHNGPLRDFLTHGVTGMWLAAPVEVEVEDSGIDRDFDRPGDFDPAGPWREKGGHHE